MPVSSKFSPTSGIFDKSTRAQKFSNFISRKAKDFKQTTKNRMIQGSHTGVDYEKRPRGANFKRAHRASAPGERPSPDTVTLVNAISDRKLSDTVAEVFIAPKMNPENGALASDYGEILQTFRNRKIMTAEDAGQEQTQIIPDGEVFIKTLL